MIIVVPKLTYTSNALSVSSPSRCSFGSEKMALHFSCLNKEQLSLRERIVKEETVRQISGLMVKAR